MATDAYRTLSKCYDALFEPVLHHAKHLGFELWPPKEGMRVLDIGCGTGAQLQLYRNSGCSIFGVDRSPSMIEEAGRKLGNEAILDLADGDALPHPSSSVDLVLLSMTLHELSGGEQSQNLDEVKRVLRREGKVLVLDYHPGPLSFPRGWLAKPLILLVERVAGREHYQNYGEFIESGGMPQLADRHRFLIDKERIIKGGNFGLFLPSTEKVADPA